MSKEWLLHKVPLCELFMMLSPKVLNLESISKSIRNQSHLECNPYILIQNQLVSFHCSPTILLCMIFLDEEKERRKLSLLIYLLPRIVFKRHLLSLWFKPVTHTNSLWFFPFFKNHFIIEKFKMYQTEQLNDPQVPNPSALPLLTHGWSYCIYIPIHISPSIKSWSKFHLIFKYFRMWKVLIFG